MCDFFDNLVYTNSSSLSGELCDDIIQLFEQDNSKYKGVTNSGFVPEFKLTMDLIIPNTICPKPTSSNKWSEIHDFLIKELKYNLKIYIDTFQRLVNDHKYKLFKNKTLGMPSLLMQKYTKNVGHFDYHDDSSIEWEDKTRRVLVFIWYLNDVNEGGETEFCGTYKIKPEIGKLIIFPAEWTFPHRGIMPKSSDKYIITGWIHSN